MHLYRYISIYLYLYYGCIGYGQVDDRSIYREMNMYMFMCKYTPKY